MKSNICFCLISALLFFSSLQSYACGPFDYYPCGYKMYRVFDKNSVVQPDERKDNCVLWRKLTSEEIPLEDIEKVVYKYTLEQTKELMSVHDTNAFSTWIRTNNDKEVYDFLMLAKMCENNRGRTNDPWYYPSKNDGTYMSLIEIEEKAKAYKETRLRDRYVLQAIRAMFSAGKYRECVDYWNGVEDDLPDGLIKNMSRSYIVGAYSWIGQFGNALKYFTDVKDLNSIIFCLKRQGKIKDVADELECIARYAPDSYRIPEILQCAVIGIESWRCSDSDAYQRRMDNTMVSVYDRGIFDKLYKLSVKMARQKTSENKAIWCYTAAFLADLDARPYEAWRYLKLAAQCPASGYMRESIRVMKIYLDAKVSSYDSAYEARLFNDLKWLDGKIKDNMTDAVRETTGETYGNYLRTNISYFYWNDMLRRILLAEICPRMLDRGMPVRALQLANMADNMLLNLNNCMDGMSLEEYRSSGSHNSVDYCSEFFMMMEDAVSINELISYVNRTKTGQTPFDKFLNERGLVDNDYFYDIIGTRYLADLNYDKAVKYLGKVSSQYQSRLNTEAYMDYDPFSMSEAGLSNYENYKLGFAEEMLRLEKSIACATDQNKKAFDLIRYGTGMRNSFTHCWGLTGYWKTNYDNKLAPFVKTVFAKVESIYNEALDVVDNDELAAIACVKLCKWKTAVDKYPDTYAARYTEMMCDNLCDYSTNWVVRTTYEFQE